MTEPRPVVFDKALGNRRGHVVTFDREHVVVQWDNNGVSTIKAMDFTTERYTLVLPKRST